MIKKGTIKKELARNQADRCYERIEKLSTKKGNGKISSPLAGEDDDDDDEGPTIITMGYQIGNNVKKNVDIKDAESTTVIKTLGSKVKRTNNIVRKPK